MCNTLRARLLCCAAPAARAMRMTMASIAMSLYTTNFVAAGTTELAFWNEISQFFGGTPDHRARSVETIGPGESQVQKNYCDEMFDQIAARAFDEQGVKNLLAVKRECPSGIPHAPLDETLGYVNGKLNCAFHDRHTYMLSPQQAADFHAEARGIHHDSNEGGIGAEFSVDMTKIAPTPVEETLQPAPPSTSSAGKECRTPPASKKAPKNLAFTGVVYHVFENGPGYKAGLRDGDIITAVNGLPVIGLKNDVVTKSMLSGTVGSEVQVSLERGPQKLAITITRDLSFPDNVWIRDLGDNVYAIVVRGFHRTGTWREIFTSIKKLPIGARYALDFRNNPGGFMDESIWAAALFVHDGMLVSERQRVESDSVLEPPHYEIREWYRKDAKLFLRITDELTGLVLRDELTGPIGQPVDEEHATQVRDQRIDIPFIGACAVVAVVNKDTASAGEIAAAALAENLNTNNLAQPNCKNSQGAKSIGSDKTFGKGIVQTVSKGPLETMVSVTTGRYFTPNGEWLGDAEEDRRGLSPQQLVPEPPDFMPYTSTDREMAAAKELLLHNDE